MKKVLVVVIVLAIGAMLLSACATSTASADWRNDGQPSQKESNVVTRGGAYVPTPTSSATVTSATPAAISTPDPNTVSGQEQLWLNSLPCDENWVVATDYELFRVDKKCVNGIDYYFFWDTKVIWWPYPIAKEVDGKLVWGEDRYAVDSQLSREEFFSRFAYFNYGVSTSSTLTPAQPPLIIDEPGSLPMNTPAPSATPAP